MDALLLRSGWLNGVVGLRVAIEGCEGLDRGKQVRTPTPPFWSQGLSKDGGPVFPHFWVLFGTIVFAVPIQWRRWFVAAGRVNMGGKVLMSL